MHWTSVSLIPGGSRSFLLSLLQSKTSIKLLLNIACTLVEPNFIVEEDSFEDRFEALLTDTKEHGMTETTDTGTSSKLLSTYGVL